MSAGGQVSTVSHSKPLLLSELRVYELKMELEKRGLDKNGVKFALVERLEAALREEGHDPEVYVFSTNDDKNSSEGASKIIAAAESSVGQVKGVEEGNHLEEEADVESGEKETEEMDTGEEALIAERGDEEQQNGEESSNFATTEESEMNDGAEEGRKDGNEVANEQQNGEDNAEDPLAEGDQEEHDDEHLDDEHLEDEPSEKPLTVTVKVDPKTLDKSAVSPESDKKEVSLWIKGIGNNTKAADLKAAFSKFGKVITAKIYVTRRQQPSTCFGLVVMTDLAAAEKSIRELHKSVFNGHTITVEKVDRNSMPAIRPGNKKAVVTKHKTGAAVSSTSGTKAKESPKSPAGKAKTKEAMETKKESVGGTGEGKSESTSEIVKRSTSKSNKVPVEAPSVVPSKRVEPVRGGIHRRFPRKHPPPTFRNGRRVVEPSERFRGSIRRSYGLRPPVRRGSFSRAPPPKRPTLVTGRGGRLLISSRSQASFLSASSYRGSSLRGSRGLYGSRVVHPSSYDPYSRREAPRRVSELDRSRERREMMETMRRKEEEYRLKEQELKLQREQERIKFERERMERERLELEQLRHLMVAPQPEAVPTSRRSHETYDTMDTSSGERRGHSSDRAGASHRGSASNTHGSRLDHRDSRDSSRRSEGYQRSSRSERGDRDRERDRSKHDTDRSVPPAREQRGYGSSSTREIMSGMSRSGHSSAYDRSAEMGYLDSSYGGVSSRRDAYRESETGYSGSQYTGYSSRGMESYDSPSTGYSREAPSYGRDASSHIPGPGRKHRISEGTRKLLQKRKRYKRDGVHGAEYTLLCKELRKSLKDDIVRYKQERERILKAAAEWQGPTNAAGENLAPYQGRYGGSSGSREAGSGDISGTWPSYGNVSSADAYMGSGSARGYDSSQMTWGSSAHSAGTYSHPASSSDTWQSPRYGSDWQGSRGGGDYLPSSYDRTYNRYDSYDKYSRRY